MALNFSNVKEWYIPEGEVTKVVFNGLTLWQKGETPTPPAPVVDPTSEVMTFGDDTEVDTTTGIVEFETTPVLQDDGVLEFSNLII